MIKENRILLQKITTYEVKTAWANIDSIFNS